MFPSPSQVSGRNARIADNAMLRNATYDSSSLSTDLYMLRLKNHIRHKVLLRSYLYNNLQQSASPPTVMRTSNFSPTTMQEPALSQIVSNTPLRREDETSLLLRRARMQFRTSVATNLPEENDEAKNEDNMDTKPKAFKREASWDAMYEELIKYKALHGDTLVPQEYKKNPKLGNWVQKQRALKKGNSIKDDRAERLDAIGFVWRVQESWEHMFDRLKHYKEEHGNVKVPKHYPSDQKLSKWVRVQRMRRKIQSAERLKLLKSVGFE